MNEDAGVTIDWAPPGTSLVSAPCRNCGVGGGKPVLLTARARLPDQALINITILDCPACGCAFAEGVPGYDYVSDVQPRVIENYVEAGAGLWPIVRTLARLRLAPGAAFVEIGCGFGFGLDFAIRAQGWRGRGIDPSAPAAAGRAQLDLPIESRFFGDRPEDVAGPGGGADAILASEVLEHMADPRDFVGRLRRGLAEGGVLVLTTPDRAELHAGLSLMEQVPLLSVGAHLVLETAESLRWLLAACGFAHVEVHRSGAQLVAYASMAPLALERDDAVLRRCYRRYLEERAAAVAVGGTLWWGFAGRAYQEAVADGDLVEASRLWSLIRPVWHTAFGGDPETVAWREVAPAGADLVWLAARGPHAMPSLLYARALERLKGGDTLAGVAPLLRAAAGAAAAQNAALLRRGAPELSTLSVQRAALAALAALGADQAAADCLVALAEAVEADPGEELALVRRSFVGLVNAGAFALAGQLQARWNIGEAALDAGGEAARDVLLCLGMVALNQVGLETKAIAYFAAARQASALGDVWWSALRGECVAGDRLGRHEATTALLRAAPAEGMPADLVLRLG